jgi:tetratricopeptide (TPR) repeat protein
MVNLPTARLSCALLFLLACSLLVHAQGLNTLQGKVITPGGSQPNTPVKVTLTYNGRRVYETFTDLSGRFSFPGVARGTYQLTAESDGQTFASTSVSAEVSAFGRGQQVFTQDIQLRALSRVAAARAGVVNAFFQTVPKPAQAAFENALDLTKAGKNEAALVKFQEAVRLFPPYFEAHLALGNHHLQAGRFAEAIAELDRARLINPNDERLYQSFGLILMRQQNYPVAVAVFSEAARLNPTNPVNPLMRGTALIHQAASVDPATPERSAERKTLLQKADQSLSSAHELSGRKLRADHLTMALYFELEGEAGRAADELEEFSRQAGTTTNLETIQKEIKRLRENAGSKASP